MVVGLCVWSMKLHAPTASPTVRYIHSSPISSIKCDLSNFFITSLPGFTNTSYSTQIHTKKKKLRLRLKSYNFQINLLVFKTFSHAFYNPLATVITKTVAKTFKKGLGLSLYTLSPLLSTFFLTSSSILIPLVSMLPTAVKNKKGLKTEICNTNIYEICKQTR